MSRFTPFKEPEPIQGDEYKPIEHVGSTLVVKVNKFEPLFQTTNTPEGGPAIFVDLLDLETEKVYRDTLWMSGAMVDNLKPYVGKSPIVVKIEERKSKTSGRKYPAPVEVDAAQLTRANAWFDSHEDPFVLKLSTVKPEDKDLPPF